MNTRYISSPYMHAILLASPLIISGFTSTIANAETKGESTFSTEVGIGYDTNVYRAPIDGEYPDYAKALIGETDNNGDLIDNTVVSTIRSGTFVPIKQTAEFNTLTSGTGKLSADLDFNGRFYSDSSYSNANQYKYKFRFGYSNIFAEKKSKAHQMYGGLVIGHVRRLYVDRDSGEDKLYSPGIPTDISERYIYDIVGIELKYENELAPLQHTFKLKQETRDYRDVADAPESQYDHDYFLLSADVSYKPANNTKISGKYSYYTYDYDERKSRDLQGRLLKSNPTRHYQYDVYGLTLRQRVSKPIVIYVDYEFKQREDDYVGYHNYDKNKYKLRVHYEFSKRIKTKFSYWMWDRDYEKAFAYDEPFKDINETMPMEKLTYDGIGYSINLTYNYTKNSDIEFEYKYTDDDSTDFRYDYERGLATVKYVVNY